MAMLSQVAGLRVNHVLSSIYGVGPLTITRLLAKLGVSPQTLVSQLSQKQISFLVFYLKHFVMVSWRLRKSYTRSIQLLRLLHTYRGVRHSRRLPVRGQRTHTNAQTVRFVSLGN